MADVSANASDSQVHSFVYFYDGANLGFSAPPPPSSRVGPLTGIAGSGFEKRFSYNLDGSRAEFALDVLGERFIGLGQPKARSTSV